VGRAVGSAVVRNRVKRQLRAAWRGLRPRVEPVDCVVVVRPAAVGLGFAALASALEGCLLGLGVLRPSLVPAVSP